MVGGAVRDSLLGLPVHDRDWLVVGATAGQMLDAGYLPVGKDFPVFLHPQTHEEYALARTERKSGHGYKGFTIHAAPDVTLEEDLGRRDLTINAIAADPPAADGDRQGAPLRLHDPFNGLQDLRNKVLRHVTAAFREDPVRILRLARFAARFADFTIAPQTLALAQEMVRAGEADHLVPERVWQELARGLMEARPSRMVQFLRDCGALAVLLPEVDCLWDTALPPGQPGSRTTIGAPPGIGVHTLQSLDVAAAMHAPLPVRYAVLLQHIGQYSAQHGCEAGLSQRMDGAAASGDLPCANQHARQAERAVSQRLKTPTEVHELASLVAAEQAAIDQSLHLGAAQWVQLLERCDAFRRPDRFVQALWARECSARSLAAALQAAQQEAVYPQRALLTAALRRTQAVETAPIAAEAVRQGLKGAQIGQQVHAARVAAVGDLKPDC